MYVSAVTAVRLCCAEEESSPVPKQQAVLKQQGVSPQLVSQQVLMQHAGQEPQPEAATSTGRLDAAPDDAALVSNACLFWVPGGGAER